MNAARLAPSPAPARAVELIDPGAAGTPNPWLIVGALAVALLLLAAAILIWRTAEPEAPIDLAYRKLARGFGLGRRDRRLLARLAEAHGQATPVALLLSEHAFRAALDAVWRSPDAEPLRADAGRLLNRVHGSPTPR